MMIDRQKLIALRQEYLDMILQYQGAIGAVNRLLDELDNDDKQMTFDELGKMIGAKVDQPEPQEE